MPTDRGCCPICRKVYALNRVSPNAGRLREHGHGWDGGSCPGSRGWPMDASKWSEDDGPTYKDAADILLPGLELALAAGWITGPDAMLDDFRRGIDMIRTLNAARQEQAEGVTQ